MKTQLINCIAAVLLATSLAAGVDDKRHVPQRLDKIRLIKPGAASKNHILLANVVGAVPSDIWTISSTYAVSRLQLNVWTNVIDRIDVCSYLLDATKCQKDFGDKAKVCVFLVDDPRLAPFTSVPGRLCVVNVKAFCSDKPDLQTMRDRCAKAILKGLAYACGAGATLERDCSMSYDSSTVAGMDRAGILISPMAYFPMLEILRVIGGDEILTPAIEE